MYSALYTRVKYIVLYSDSVNINVPIYENRKKNETILVFTQRNTFAAYNII